MKKLINFRLLFFAIALFLVKINLVSAAATPIIQIESGKIQGTVEDGVECYKGIPYAAPPVGNLRWRPPVAPESWNGIKQVTEFANYAAQRGDLAEFATPGGSDDCLYLNVFVPQAAKVKNKKLPVFFWIHGGALLVGASNDYNPIPLAKTGESIVVTINFRLGALGFFAHPALDNEGHAAINYGLMDQIAALDWVQKNISQFGGDPNKVTIAGQSTGAQSVLALVTSPKAAGKFQAAVSMSGCTTLTESFSKESAEKLGVQLAEKAGLKNATAAQLRNLSVEEILKVQVQPKFAVDGEYLPESPADALLKGHVNNVILVNGTTSNEGAFVISVTESLTGKTFSEKQYEGFAKNLQPLLNIDSEKILAEYPLKNFENAGAATVAIVTDGLFALNEERLNRALEGKIPVYAYEFADVTAPPYLKADFNQGAAHTYDIPYIFSGFHGRSELSTKLNSRQEKLSREMMIFWTHVLDLPNQKKWTPYNSKLQNYFIFKLGKSKMENGKFAKRHNLDFWENK